MTTGLQIALASGALVGLGIAAVIWLLVPARADAADVVRRYSAAGARARNQTTEDALMSTSATDRAGVWAMRRLPAAWWGTPPTRELALLRIPLHRHYGTKITYLLVGLISPPFLAYLASLVGFTLPVMLPVAATIGLAAFMWVTPDFEVRKKAVAARADFTRALGAYTDLVAIDRLGGSGPRQAMESAADIGDNWVFTRLAEELARSAWNGQAPWDALEALSDELGLLELDEFADVMRLTGEGSQVYAQLRARSDAFRAAMLSADLSKANAASEAMSAPTALLSIVFLIILLTPALLQLTGGA